MHAKKLVGKPNVKSLHGERESWRKDNITR